MGEGKEIGEKRRGVKEEGLIEQEMHGHFCARL